MNSQQLQGCKEQTANLIKLLDDFTGNIIGRKGNGALVTSIKRDLDNIVRFIGDDAPEWVTDLLKLCNQYEKNQTATSSEIIKMRGRLEHYSWDNFSDDDNDKLNYDKVFREEAAANGLNDAIDRLVDCLKIIRNESSFHLDKSTKSDIDTLIKGLNSSKGASESAIRNWADSGWLFIKTFIPHVDKIEALNDFINKTPDAFDEICLKVIDAKNKSIQRMKKQFYVEDHLVLPPAQDQKQLDSPQEDK